MSYNLIIKIREKSVSQILFKSTERKKSEVSQSIQLFMTSWTVAYQVPLSMEFSRQEYWSGLPFPSPGESSWPGIEPRSPALQADALPSEPPGKPTDYVSNVKKAKSLSCVQLFATPWTVAYQVLPSMGFSRQECWSGLPLPSPGDLRKHQKKTEDLKPLVN